MGWHSSVPARSGSGRPSSSPPWRSRSTPSTASCTPNTPMEENTKLLRSQDRHNALTLSQRARELLIENEGFARIVHVGYATPDALSDVDWARCSSYMFLQFNQ